MVVKIRWVIVIVLIVGLISLPYLLLGSAIAANPLSTRSLRTTFAKQATIFTKPLASLGVIGRATNSVQCVADHSARFTAYYLCLDTSIYPYNTNPISTAAQAKYSVNAAKIDLLLKQNGWINDRPHDAITTLVDSNPYLPLNGGVGAEVPFHKNIGTVSCNLEVDFNSLSGEIDPGSINVNYFSCQQKIRLFMPKVGAINTLL
jgi:hypothetical protein